MQCQQLTKARDDGKNKLGIFIKEPELVDPVALENTEKAPFRPTIVTRRMQRFAGEVARLQSQRQSGAQERAHILNEERKETKTSFAKRFSSLLSLSGPQPIL